MVPGELLDCMLITSGVTLTLFTYYLLTLN